MPPFALQPSELAGIVAFIRAGFDTTASIRVGNAARGQAIFDGKGQCATCHRVAGKARVWLPISATSGWRARRRRSIDRIRDPSSAMMPINRPVRIVMKDGSTITRPPAERGHLHGAAHRRPGAAALAREDATSRRMNVETKSPMPSYAGKLTDEEIADVVAYLLTLRDSNEP